MNIGKQVLRDSIALLVLFFVFSLAIQKLIIMPGFNELERMEGIKDVHRTYDALQSEIKHLDNLNWDWAAWDDTYEFIIDHNNDYIDSNLVESSFTDNDLNIIFLVDLAGKVVWGQSMDLETEESVEITEFPPNLFPNDHPLMGLDTVNAFRSGIMITSFGPMLISSRPIVTSDVEGPVRGTIIMGRILGADYTEQIGIQTHTNIKIWDIHSESIPADEKRIISMIDDREKFLLTEFSDKILHGYTLIHDIQNKPVLLIRLEISRDISNSGQGVSRYSFWVTIFIALLLVGIFFNILRKSLVRPLQEITRYITGVGKSFDLDEKIVIEGCSEVMLIADTFNDMSNNLASNRDEMVDRSFHSGMSEITTGVIHNIRNTINPLVTDLGLFKEQFNDLPAENMVKAFKELKDNQIDSDRRSKLSEFLALSLDHLVDLKRIVDDEISHMDNHVLQTTKLLEDLDEFATSGFVPERFHVNKLISDSMALFSNRFPGCSVDIDLGDVETITSHRSVLILMFMNLLYNAGDAIYASGKKDEGRVEVRVIREIDNGEEFAHFTISDNGIGISKENMPKIFERDFSTKRKMISGTGLHWCANTIHTLKGTIYAESDGEGLGASFHVVLPVEIQD